MATLQASNPPHAPNEDGKGALEKIDVAAEGLAVPIDTPVKKRNRFVR